MRLLFICMLSFAGLKNAFGQVELLGKYETEYGAYVRFVGKDSFYYRSYGCSQSSYGHGTCEVNENYLYLHFRGTQFPEKKPIVIKTKCLDSIARIQVTCRNYDSIAIPGVDITFPPTRIGTSTNRNGIAVLKMRNASIPLTIHAISYGNSLYKLKIYPGYDYTVDVFLRPGYFDLEFHNGEVIIYEIEDISEDMILMRPEGSKKNFSEYRRKK